jgi:hypothetical protein
VTRRYYHKSVDNEAAIKLYALHIWIELICLVCDKAISDKPRAERMGSLVLDEMSIASSVEFNSQELKFDGFVDFGDLVTIDEQSNSLADHALVLMFRPYRSNWVQPIGVFASKGRLEKFFTK